MKRTLHPAWMAGLLLGFTLPAWGITDVIVQIAQDGNTISAFGTVIPDGWDSYYFQCGEGYCSSALIVDVMIEKDGVPVADSGVFWGVYGWYGQYFPTQASVWPPIIYAADPQSATYTAKAFYGHAGCYSYDCEDPYWWFQVWEPEPMQDSLYYEHYHPLAPVISLVAPNRAVVNHSGYAIFYGENLNQPGTVVKLNGYTLTPDYVATDGSQINAPFAPHMVPSVGSAPLSVSNIHGQVTAILEVEVSDRRPQIWSVSELEWPAGATILVVIEGAYFGTNPIIELRCNGGGLCPGVTFAPILAWDHIVAGTVTVSSDVTPQAIDVTVTSQGLWGFGFLAFQGQPSPTSQPASPKPQVVPRLRITHYTGGSETDVTGTTLSGIVGEVFQAFTPKLGPSTTTGGTWTIPPQASTVWNVDAGEAGAHTTTYQLLGPVNPLVGFTFISGASQAELKYQLGSQTASVFFNVVAPTVVSLEVKAEGVVQVFQDPNDGYKWKLVYRSPVGYPDPNLPPNVYRLDGINFFATITDPQGYTGRIEWVQVVNSFQYRRWAGGHVQAEWSCKDAQGNFLPAFDGDFYPMMTGDRQQDSPTKFLEVNGIDFPAGPAYPFGKPFTGADKFDASGNFTTWVMYQPLTKNGVQVSNSRIPLAKIDWAFSGEATYNGSGWVAGPNNGGTALNQSIPPTADFPFWQRSARLDCAWQ